MKKFIIPFLFLVLSPASAFANDDVRCVQAFLADTAFDPGPVDGQWGRRTAEALESFAQQAGIEVDGGLDRSNVSEICAVFDADADGSLKAMGHLRKYEIVIDQGVLAAIDPTYFDFSSFGLYQGPDMSCAFNFFTDDKGIDVWERARGSVEIVESRLVFGLHFYEIGYDQLANQTYLQELSNLMLLESGQIVGRTPYFWDYIQQGMISRRPVDAILSFKYEPGSTFPDGSSYFEIPQIGDQTGILELRCS